MPTCNLLPVTMRPVKRMSIIGRIRNTAPKRRQLRTHAAYRRRPHHAQHCSRPNIMKNTSVQLLRVSVKDLPLFKQLASDLASLDKALVKIHSSREKSNGKVDESLLTTLIEEVQREQEAWFKQVQVMEKLVEQAATLETSQTELDQLRQKYDDMRRKVDLYYGLLEEREREVDTLKQQLEDVNTVVEMNERKNAALKELVVAGTSTTQEEMGLPTWTPTEVSTFFVKNKDSSDQKTVETTGSPVEIVPTSLPSKRFMKRVEVPGIAFVSIVLVLARVSGTVWDSTMRHVPKEIKALIEITGLCAILLTAAAVGSKGFM